MGWAGRPESGWRTARNQPAIVCANNPILHRLVGQIYLRDAELLQLGTNVGITLRFIRNSPAAPVLFHEFVHPLFELLPPAPLLLQLRLVCGLPPRHILTHVFIDRLLASIAKKVATNPVVSSEWHGSSRRSRNSPRVSRPITMPRCRSANFRLASNEAMKSTGSRLCLVTSSTRRTRRLE